MKPPQERDSAALGRRAALALGLGLPGLLPLSKRVLARSFCLAGPILTLELRGDYSRLTAGERATVERIIQELRELR